MAAGDAAGEGMRLRRGSTARSTRSGRRRFRGIRSQGATWEAGRCRMVRTSPVVSLTTTGCSKGAGLLALGASLCRDRVHPPPRFILASRHIPRLSRGRPWQRLQVRCVADGARGLRRYFAQPGGRGCQPAQRLAVGNRRQALPRGQASDAHRPRHSDWRVCPPCPPLSSI